MHNITTQCKRMIHVCLGKTWYCNHDTRGRWSTDGQPCFTLSSNMLQPYLESSNSALSIYCSRDRSSASGSLRVRATKIWGLLTWTWSTPGLPGQTPGKYKIGDQHRPAITGTYWYYPVLSGTVFSGRWTRDVKGDFSPKANRQATALAASTNWLHWIRQGSNMFKYKTVTTPLDE